MTRISTYTPRRWSLQRKLAILFSASYIGMCGAGQAAQQNTVCLSTPPALTQIVKIRNLQPDQAACGYPARVRGVVTYYQGKRGDVFIFVQDSTGGIFVEFRGDEPPLRPGDFVELEGTSAAGDYAPIIRNPHFRVVGIAPMPKPHRPAFERILSGVEDSQWVEVEGIVRTVSEDETQPFLTLAVGTNRLTIRTPPTPAHTFAKFVDSKVRVLGVCGGIFNSKRQLLGVVLYAPSLRQIAIAEPARPDPFSVPIRPITSLLGFTPNQSGDHRVRVRGVVTLRRESMLYVRDTGDSIEALTADSTPRRWGTLLMCWGSPKPGRLRPFCKMRCSVKLADHRRALPKV